MDFFNKTKASLKNAGAAISQKASGVSNTVTLTMKIKDTEKEIKECQYEIGKIMTDEHYEDLKAICPEVCNRIQELMDQLEADKKELISAKGLQICPNCGSEESADSICCTKCGTKMKDESQVAQEKEAKVCANCGNKVEPGTFCSNCGTKAE